ncbi:hypothetical protein K491DRAFT_645017 [Lophiostoma macrostomum CBS 122681]|uniref:Uncharacterized protein n=1 Tax=Lophiostoma macrostomum CBS 122681 TaxID=1314788 RepID=A0A6A6TWE1_9PLEO|nr:hypothetical protein K491DRAFT_645017 [Lophiostoma macrostomum CBS 122681]
MPGIEYTPAPDARELLPPLLACLSTASASRQPPPALFPQLSPILRQRVQLLASDDWLPLLTWDSQVASRLPQIVSNIRVEPHPASGEIEVDEPDCILYRRSDPETLHSRLVLGEFGLIPTYLWCTGGESGSGWKLAELRGAEDAEDGTEWYSTMAEANEAGFRRKPLKTNGATIHNVGAPATSQPEQAKQEEDDDDAYWAAYDQTPGGTPQQKRSPAPRTASRVQVGPTQSELEYFARYAMEVQPALDAHDPDEEGPAPGESTLNGNSLDFRQGPEQALDTETNGVNGFIDTTDSRKDSLGDNDSNKAEHIERVDDEDRFAALEHPRPSSSASTNSVERLERKAESHTQAELAIKQHISTDLKSLFRLARASGIEREEFERIIKRELEVLPLLEQDD